MARHPRTPRSLATTLLLWVAFSLSLPDTTLAESEAIDQLAVEHCGMTISPPKVNNIHGEQLSFDCNTADKEDGYFTLEMDFQYDQNLRNGGEYIGFVIRKMSIDKMEKTLSKPFLGADSTKTISQLPYTTQQKKKTYCGLNASTKVTPIQGVNWHGWLVEEIRAGKPHRHCTVPKEYTTRYRCVGLMIGNDKVSAMTNKFCLLRNRELSLEHGFSYDLFMDMLKTIRFNNGQVSAN